LIVPQPPFIGKRQAIGDEMPADAVEAGQDIVFWHMMAAQLHSQRHTIDGLRSRADDDVGLAAERGIER
jgi:hypothetical protein